MNKVLRLSLAAGVLLGGAVATYAADPKQIADAHGRASKALAILTCRAGDPPQGRSITTMALCVAKDSAGHGVFMSFGIDRVSLARGLNEVKLRPAGVGGKSLKARLIGLDPMTSIAFIQALEKHDWSVVKFAAKSDLAVGKAVVSVGALPSDAGYEPYVGAANVSAILRTPGRTVYVTGGTLTNIGSPVFSGGTAAIGIVGRQQLYRGFSVQTQRGAQNLAIRGVQETVHFTPVEEFVGALTRIKSLTLKTRPPWIGVLTFKGLEGPLAELAKIKTPAVVLTGVVPGGPAHAAGLQDRDIIVSINGKNLEALAGPGLMAANVRKTISLAGVGGKVRVGYIRGAERNEVTVTLTEMPMMPQEAPRAMSAPIGIVVRDMVSLDRSIGKGAAARAKGVVVMNLQRDGSAQNAGVQVGDVIAGIGNTAIVSTVQFDEVMKKVLANRDLRVVTLQVVRQNQALRIDVPVRRR